MAALFVSACSDSSNESHIYTGNSGNWKVNYARDEVLTIKYIGEEPIPEEEINYIIKQGTRTTDGNIPLNEDGVLSITRPFSNNVEHEDIYITVNWEGKSDEIELEKL